MSGPLRVSRLVAFATAMVTIPLTVFAQQSSDARLEVGGDVRFLTGVHFNDVDAREGAFGGATRVVFTSSSSLGQAACAEGRVGVGVAAAFDVEGSVAFGRPHLSTKIAQDPEASDLVIAEPLTTYLIEGGVAAHPAKWRRGRSAPFVTAGLGYLRQIHEGNTLVEGGAVWYVGGGLRYPITDRAPDAKRGAAFRLELRATILTGSSALDGATHVLPAALAGVFFHF